MADSDGQIVADVKAREHRIFDEEDFENIEKVRRNIILTPLKVMGGFACLAAFFKYADLGRYFANPLATDPRQTFMSPLLKTKGKFVFWHTLVFLGIGSCMGAFLAGEFHTFQVYMKYRKEVSYYMRWKI